jgi:hypothetical protein
MMLRHSLMTVSLGLVPVLGSCRATAKQDLQSEWGTTYRSASLDTRRGRAGYTWVRGHWIRGRGGWCWDEGYWVRDRPRFEYVQGGWVRGPDRDWRWVSGHWRRHAVATNSDISRYLPRHGDGEREKTSASARDPDRRGSR